MSTGTTASGAADGAGRPSRVGVAALLAWCLAIGIVPLLSGAPGGDDAYYHAMYAVEHARCLRAGVILPRWYPDLNGGLGGPEPRPRPILPLLLGGALALALGDGVAAISLITALTPMVAGFLALLAFRRLGLAGAAGLRAAAAWAACPYLVISLHQRVALQEVLALAMLPLVIALLAPPRPRTVKGAAAAALAFAGLLVTQLLVALMATVAVALLHLLSRDRRLAGAVVAGVAGAGLAAVSWVPNVASLERVRGGSFVAGWFDWHTRFLFGGETVTSDVGRAFGWAFVGLVAAGLLLATGSGSRLAAGVGLGCAAMATSLSRPLWELVPGFDLLQFPWRWLGVASCLVLVAAVVSNSAWRREVAIVLLVFPALAARPLADRLPDGAPMRVAGSTIEIAQAATRFGAPPILPSFPAALPRGADPFEALQAAARLDRTAVETRASGPSRWSWVVVTKRNGALTLPLLADDGWEVRVDGRLRGWKADRSLVSVNIVAGEREVEARQALLPEDVWGIAVSAAAAVLLAALTVTAARRPADRGRRREP